MVNTYNPDYDVSDEVISELLTTQRRLCDALEEIANGKYNGRLAVIIANLALYPELKAELNVSERTEK